MSSLRDLIKWILGGSFILIGASRLIEGSIIGVLIIVVGLFVIPPFLASIEKNAGFHIQRPLKYVVVAFVFLLIIATGENKPESIAATDEPIEELVPEETKSEKEYSIISNAETFRRRFNSSMTEVKNSSLRIRSLSIDDGEVNNVFSYMLTDHISIIGQLNKSDDSIRSILLTMQGDGTFQSGLNMMTTILAVIRSTSPELSPEERGDVLKKLGLLKDDIDINKINSRVTKNGIRYSLQGDEMIGLMFAVGNADEDD